MVETTKQVLAKILTVSVIRAVYETPVLPPELTVLRALTRPSAWLVATLWQI
jgi:hypothetical protein